MDNHAERVVESVEQRLRLGKLYLVLSASPMLIMFSSLFGGLTLNSDGAKALFVATLVMFSVTSALAFKGVTTLHKTLIDVADLRRDEQAVPDIALSVAEEVFSKNSANATWQLRFYPIALGISYFALVYFVASQI